MCSIRRYKYRLLPDFSLQCLSSSCVVHIKFEFEFEFNDITMFFGLIEKYKSLKSDYLSLTPREKWKVVRNALSVAFSCIGLKVFDPNFELRWYSYISAFTCVYAMTLFPYTIWYYRSEPIKALSYTPYLAILIPVSLAIHPRNNSLLLNQVIAIYLIIK